MDRCFEDVPQSSQDYYPNYNLFQSSVYYDMDNFRDAYLSLRYDCEASETGQRSPGPPDSTDEAAPEPAADGKRVISKEDLYKDPDLFRSKLDDTPPPTPEVPYPAATQPWGYDWTRQSWVKSGGKATFGRKEGRVAVKTGKQIYNQLVNAPKISLSKAESMMQKMGWQGGALGKGANGILEPITPNPIYCSSNIGFGQHTKINKKMKIPTPIRKVTKKGSFRTNVLLHILDFVRDDTEIELLFDPLLRPCERRSIHTMVEVIINGGDTVNLSDAQRDAVNDIHEYNKYELRTLSVGEPPKRQITVYKEAPQNVYLVTPDDFLEDEETDEQTNETKPDVNSSSDATVAKVEKETLEPTVMDVEDDENPFLKSIKKSIKKDEAITNKFEKDCNIDNGQTVDLTKDTPKDKMIEFFIEFADSDDYSEFRFLGKFSEEQTSVIDEFLNDVEACIRDLDSFTGNEVMLKVFTRGGFEMKDGCNGTVEIHKLPSQR